MKTATALVVRPAPHPPLGGEEWCPGQYPLPLPGLRRIPPVMPPEPRPTSLRARATHFMQVLVEVLAGLRPVNQLAAWTAPDVFEQLQQRMRLGTRLGPAQGTGPRIASVHVAMVGDEAAEIAARMVHRGRSRAIAVRLELQTDGRGRRHWRCAAVAWA